MTAAPTSDEAVRGEVVSDSDLEPEFAEGADSAQPNVAASPADNEQEPDDWFESDRHDLEAFWDSPQPPEKRTWLKDRSTPPNSSGGKVMGTRITDEKISFSESTVQKGLLFLSGLYVGLLSGSLYLPRGSHFVGGRISADESLER